MKISKRLPTIAKAISRATLALVLSGCAWAVSTAHAGWTALTSLAPDNVELMLLLPDGTIMAANAYTTGGGYGNAWYKLTPDNTGHYNDGVWSSRASATYTRLWCSSDVLQNGKVFVAGGEYGNGGLTAELYDPVANSWSTISVPTGTIYTGPSGDAENSGFRDSQSRVLPNGKIMIAPVFPGTNNATVIYDPVANSLSLGPAYLASQNEAGWVKLPDGSILTVDKNSFTTERFIPSENKWIADNNAPVNLYDSFGKEEGPGFLLPNGKVVFFGGNGLTAIYTPSGTTTPGTWVQGPSIPGGNAMADAGGCMMVNGKILIAASQAPYSTSNVFNPPAYFYEYDYTTGTTGGFTQVASPTGGLSDNVPAFDCLMLALPDGNVLFSDFNRQLYIYTPTSGQLSAGTPTVQALTPNANDGNTTATGILFNGISEGAAYGDDAQMGSDYPLVRLTDGSGHVSYPRSFNWSSTIVDYPYSVSTEFDATALVPGNYSLQVVANGFASAAVTYSQPVWVDFNFSSFVYLGSYDFPDNTLASGISQVSSGGRINIKSSNSTETLTISKPMTITSVGGPSAIGVSN